jgi:hypothetical protein
MPESAIPITDRLITAAQRGELPAIISYLESGGDINERSASGSTLLIEAARAGQGWVVGVLLSQKASVRPRDTTRAAALHVAAMNGHIAVVEDLIRAHRAEGVSLNVLDNSDNTPLYYAIHNKHRDIVFRLLDNFASILEAPPMQKSLLLIAAETGDVPYIAATLDYYNERAYDIDNKNEMGNTPLVCAIHAGNPEAVKLLIKAGARRDKLLRNHVTPIHQQSHQLIYFFYDILESHDVTIRGF